MEELEEYRSEMQEIISAPPPWLVRWGMTVFFFILLVVVGLSGLIQYPDIIKTKLTVMSNDIPKPVMTRSAGKLAKILVKEKQHVLAGQPLAYLESTGDHEQILEMVPKLKAMRSQIAAGGNVSIAFLNVSDTFEFGELQNSYQSFYQVFINYQATTVNGLDSKNKQYLEEDLKAINDQRQNLLKQKKLQEADYLLAKQEYEMHRTLLDQKVEAKIEFQREESRFISQHYPLQQTENALISNTNTYANKEKEIMQLNNLVHEERLRFFQALNNFISEIESWKSRYVLTAAQSGILHYSEFIQENQFIDIGRELFFTEDDRNVFFGEMPVPQFNMGKIREGQEVLVKLKSYPYQEYGMLHGKIMAISHIAAKDSVFNTQVRFERMYSTGKSDIVLKNGMTADAEIITQDATLLKRLLNTVLKFVDRP